MVIYQRLIPALAIQYCKDNSFDFEYEGSTTSSFDSVKQFYLDVYEALGNLMIIPVALNNIKYGINIEVMMMDLTYLLEKFSRLLKIHINKGLVFANKVMGSEFPLWLKIVDIAWRY